MDSPLYVAVAGVAAGLVLLTAHPLESRYRAIVWLDAMALAVAVAAGLPFARVSYPPILGQVSV